MKPVGKVIKNILLCLEVKCPNKECEKLMSLEKYEDHEYFCLLPKCQNTLCSVGTEKLVSVILFIFNNNNIYNLSLFTIMKNTDVVMRCVSIHSFSKE